MITGDKDKTTLQRIADEFNKEYWRATTIADIDPEVRKIAAQNSMLLGRQLVYELGRQGISDTLLNPNFVKEVFEVSKGQ